MSCLFIAISRGLSGLYTHQEVRSMIVSYLENDGPLFSDKNAHEVISSFEDPKEYFRRMRLHSTWGGGIEIRAAVEIFKVLIYIHTTFDEDVIKWSSITHNSDRIIHIKYNGSHYEFLCLI